MFNRCRGFLVKSAPLVLASLMSISGTTWASEDVLTGLERLHWKHRVLLVLAQEPLATRAMANLNEQVNELEERDVLWFLISGDAMHTNFDGTVDPELREKLLEAYFTPAPDGTSVVLIGKDGGVKSRTSDLDLVTTFRLIDRMPMRKEEMRRGR